MNIRSEPQQDIQFAIGDVEFDSEGSKYLHLSFVSKDLSELIAQRHAAHPSHPGVVHKVDMNDVKRLAATTGMNYGKREMVKIMERLGHYFDLAQQQNSSDNQLDRPHATVESPRKMTENTKTPIEEIWVNTTLTVIPKSGDYVSVSAENIQQFAQALFAKFDQALCIALENYDDDHLNDLIRSARGQVFPIDKDDSLQASSRPKP